MISFKNVTYIIKNKTILNNITFKEDFKLFSINKDYIHFSSSNALIYYFSYENKYSVRRKDKRTLFH